MKKIIIVLLAAVIVAAAGVPAFAAGGMSEGASGVNVGLGNSVFGDTGIVRISGKYFIARDLALLGGFGFQTSSGDYDTDVFSFQIGARKYLSTGDFAPFVGGRLTFEKIEITVPGLQEDVDVIDIMGEFGAEYFFSKQFSVEGSIGLGFGTVDLGVTDYTYLGTRTVGVSANFYF